MDNSTKHIPFAVIVAATIGDEAAIQKILDFYDGYISKLSLRKLYDEYGNVYMVVDFHRLANTVGSSLTTE